MIELRGVPANRLKGHWLKGLYKGNPINKKHVKLAGMLCYEGSLACRYRQDCQVNSMGNTANCCYSETNEGLDKLKPPIDCYPALLALAARNNRVSATTSWLTRWSRTAELQVSKLH